MLGKMSLNTEILNHLLCYFIKGLKVIRQNRSNDIAESD